MNRHEFSAMGTQWSIHCDAPVALDAAEALVRDAESRLSRFQSSSALSRLNSDRVAEDPFLAAVTLAALALRRMTKGAFDPTLGRELADLGYDRTFDAIDHPRVAHPSTRERPDVVVDGDVVRLFGEGALDLGGIAKGWTADRVAELLLERGATTALVDAGGDIRVAGGPWPVGVGDDMALTLSDAAVATSSTRRRRWATRDGRAFHHIVDPQTGSSVSSPIDTVTVVAADAATADGLATAVLVDSRRLPVLVELGARALVRSEDGSWWTTTNWGESR